MEAPPNEAQSGVDGDPEPNGGEAAAALSSQSLGGIRRRRESIRNHHISPSTPKLSKSLDPEDENEPPSEINVARALFPSASVRFSGLENGDRHCAFKILQ